MNERLFSMITSDILTVGAPAPAKSESTLASVRRMLKNAILISVRDSVLLKLAIVGFVLVALYSALFSLGILVFPHLSGHPCNTLNDLNAFYADLPKDGRRLFWFIMYILPFQLFGTFLTNLMLMALDSEIVRVWNGRKADFKRGWRTARQHIKAIAAWSELTMPINGMWIVSMCMVIPVLTRDDTLNPFKMFWRSLKLLLKIWKEFLLGIVGMLVILYWITCTVIGSVAIFKFIESRCPSVLAWCLLALGASFLLIAFCFALLCCNAYLCGQYIKASEGVEPTPDADPDGLD